MEFTFKNYFFAAIGAALDYPNQNFQVGRSKIRISKILEEKNSVLNKSRLEMLTSLCEKDAAGKPVLKNQMNQKGKIEQIYVLSPENRVKFEEELKKMMDEDCIVEIPDSLKNDLSIFKGLLANSQAQGLLDGEIGIIEEVLEVLHSNDKKETTAAPAK